MRIKNIKILGFAYFFLAVAYGFLLANIDIISNIDFVDILDRQNYIYYAEAPLEILNRNINQSILYAIFNEPLFLLINWFAGGIIGDAISTVRFIIFFSSFIAAYIAFRKSSNFFVSITILFIPFVFGNYVLSLRQGVALSFFLIGWYAKDRKLRVILMGISPLVHISFIIPLLFISLALFAKKIKINKYINIILFLFICFSAIFAAQYIGSYLGIRQTEGYYEGFAQESKTSGLGLFFWMVIFILFITSKKDFAHENLFSIYCIIFYAICYIIFPPFSRTIQNHALIILLAGSFLTGANKYVFNFSIGTVFIFTCIGIFNNGFLYSFYA